MGEKPLFADGLQLWWVLPAAVASATVAVGSTVSGALFFSPFFLLVVGLSPAQAIGVGLRTAFSSLFSDSGSWCSRVS